MTCDIKHFLLDFDSDLELIQEILPNESEEKIKKALEETGDVGKAMRLLLNLNNQRCNQRTSVLIHPSCKEMAISAAKEALVSVRSSTINVSEIAPEFTISISFQGAPCKPMIFIEPVPFDLQFCRSIEPKSIILTEKFDDSEIKAFTSFYGVSILPLTKQNVTFAVRFVLIENGVIGDGYGPIVHGNVWEEMLRQIPMISSSFTSVITNSIPSPYAVVHNCPNQLISKAGNKLPQRILNNLKMFYTTDDPEQKIETGPQKRTI